MTGTNGEGHGHHGGAGHGHGSFEPEEGGRQVPYSHEQPLACPIGDEKGKKHFFDDPERVKWVLRILYTICGGLFVVDFFFHRHAVHPWEHVWGFYPIYGFVACVLLVLAAKEMRKVLMRDLDYYGDTGRERGPTGGGARGAHGDGEDDGSDHGGHGDRGGDAAAGGEPGGGGAGSGHGRDVSGPGGGAG